MGIIKLEDEMTKAELLATQNSNNGYNEMIVDDMVDSILPKGVILWEGDATTGTLTLSQSASNFTHLLVETSGAMGVRHSIVGSSGQQYLSLDNIADGATATGSWATMAEVQLNISGSAITIGFNSRVQISNTGTERLNDNDIEVRRIIGLRFY